MKKLILSLSLLLGACTNAPHNTGKAEYVFIGLDKCSSTKSNSDGTTNFSFMDLFGVENQFILFKQKNADGTVGNINASEAKCW